MTLQKLPCAHVKCTWDPLQYARECVKLERDFLEIEPDQKIGRKHLNSAISASEKTAGSV